MSRPSAKPFNPLLPTEPTRPRSAFFGSAGPQNIIRDQLTISTWLLLGGLAQAPLYYIFGRLAFLPTILILAYRVLDAYAQATGWKRNTYMDGILLKKFSAQFPDAEGEYGAQPARDGVVVLLIGTRCNHPMGLLAPGFKETGDYFTQMAKDLDTHAEEFGFLGMSSYLNANARTTGSELMNVAYFKTTAGLHAFAHSDYHRGGWNWWNKTVAQHPHISIYHEVFEAPKGHWENIYVNSHVAGITATTHKTIDEEGREVWASPVVDASRGLLKTSAGRMSRSQAKEHEEYAYHDIYDRLGKEN